MNENDFRLIEFCRGRPKTMKEIASNLEINLKNIIVRLPLLEKEKLIKVKYSQFLKKKVVQTIQNKEIDKEIINILKVIKKSNGELTEENLAKKMFSYSFSYSKEVEDDAEKVFFLRNQAFSQVIWSDFIERKIKISEKGEEFINEYLKKNGK